MKECVTGKTERDVLICRIPTVVNSKIYMFRYVKYFWFVYIYKPVSTYVTKLQLYNCYVHKKAYGEGKQMGR